MSRAGQCWNLNSDPWKYHKVESGGYSGQAREVSCSGIPSWFVLPYESISTRHCTSIMFCRMQWTTWRDFSSSVQPTKDVSEDSVLCSGSTATYENYYEEIKPAKGNRVGALLTLTHFDVAIIIFRWKKISSQGISYHLSSHQQPLQCRYPLKPTYMCKCELLATACCCHDEMVSSRRKMG